MLRALSKIHVYVKGYALRLRSLSMWFRPRFLALGPTLGVSCCRRRLTADASLMGWGAVLSGRPAQGEWEGHQLNWHINCLKMMTVFLALKYFLPQLRDRHVLVQHSAVSYINYQGGLCSRNLNRIARQIFLWAQEKFLSLRAVYISGHLNVGADLLFRQKLPIGEWKLHPEVVKQIWTRFYEVVLDLFASYQKAQCPLYFSLNHPAPGSGCDGAHMAQNVPVCVSSSFSAPGSSSQSLVLRDISLLNGSPWTIPERRDFLFQTEATIFHPRPSLWNLHVWPLMGTK